MSLRLPQGGLKAKGQLRGTGDSSLNRWGHVCGGMKGRALNMFQGFIRILVCSSMTSILTNFAFSCTLAPL